MLVVLLLVLSMSHAAELDAVLSCDGPGWAPGEAGVALVTDTEVRVEGSGAQRLTRDGSSPDTWSSLTHAAPLEVAGKELTLRGRLRTADVSGRAGLWVRVDGLEGPLAIDNMRRQPVAGTTDWQRVSVSVPLTAGARRIAFGSLLVGTGTLWMDDLELRVDGKPIGKLPRQPPELTVLDTDTEFDGDSGIHLTALSPVQVDHVALLIKAWGLVKYTHPAVLAGQHQWDYALFRMLPAVLEAGDASTAAAAIDAFIATLGELPASDTSIPEAVHLAPDLEWVDAAPEPLATTLRALWENRSSNGDNFVFGVGRGIGNPVFRNERSYPEPKLPDPGYRILALARVWTVVQLWSPYRDELDVDWHELLASAVSEAVAADSAEAYERWLLRVLGEVKDTHTNLWGGRPHQPPGGDCRASAEVRFLDGQAVVWRSEEEDLPVGSVIDTLAGRPVSDWVAEWRPMYPASNDAAQLRAIGQMLLTGECVPASLTGSHLGEPFALSVPRTERKPLAWTHDHGGGVQLLTDDIAYFAMSAADTVSAKDVLKAAKHSRGLVLDLRNYPSEFFVFSLGRHLVAEPTPFVRFSSVVAGTPGATTLGEPLRLTPKRPTYAGRVVVLVDETTQSSAEYHAMAFRQAPGALVVGSQTAGADGNVSGFPLPGGYRTMISGLGVFTPEGGRTQRVGIVPDIVVVPTAAGLAAGRDEVLEGALVELGVPRVEVADVAAWPVD
ncbi:MAG: hypothetical protein ACI8PZ_005572 [Myxococcota bacterium]